AVSSDGEDHFRHWAVLVREMTLVDAQAIMLRTRGCWHSDDTEPGTMYELVRDEKDHNNVNIKRPFGVATIRTEWGAFSVQYVGETTMTYKMIEREGTRLFLTPLIDNPLARRIVDERPN